MRRAAALLAAALCAAATGCGGGGAEPGASREATLVLDFTPNAVHAGLYVALAEGELERRDVALEVREPSSATDAPKLLEAGRADAAILDVSDFGIARARGLRLRAIAAVVQVPLAAVIARDASAVRRPRDLEGATVGVAGLPSDDAVLDAVLRADRADPEAVERQTIGFDAVAALTSGAVEAATAFWNAEGVALRQAGLPTREFRVADAVQRPFPELVVVVTERTARRQPGLVAALRRALDAGTRAAVADPDGAIEALADAVPELDADVQRRQLDALLEARAFGRPPSVRVRRDAAGAWLAFAVPGGLVEREDRERVARGFEPPPETERPSRPPGGGKEGRSAGGPG